jgi:hypothetical protein
MSLKETAARTILRASGLSGLRGDDVPLDLHHILKSVLRGTALSLFSLLFLKEKIDARQFLLAMASHC